MDLCFAVGLLLILLFGLSIEFERQGLYVKRVRLLHMPYVNTKTGFRQSGLGIFGGLLESEGVYLTRLATLIRRRISWARPWAAILAQIRATCVLVVL